jgi:hypothetical protein
MALLLSFTFFLQLDENVSSEGLERCIAYFNTVYPVLLGGETKANQTHLLSDSGRALSSACDSIRTDAIAIKTLIQVPFRPLSENTEMHCLHFCKNSPQKVVNHRFYVFMVLWMEIKTSSVWWA